MLHSQLLHPLTYAPYRCTWGQVVLGLRHLTFPTKARDEHKPVAPVVAPVVFRRHHSHLFCCCRLPPSRPSRLLHPASTSSPYLDALPRVPKALQHRRQALSLWCFPARGLPFPSPLLVTFGPSGPASSMLLLPRKNPSSLTATERQMGLSGAAMFP